MLITYPFTVVFIRCLALRLICLETVVFYIYGSCKRRRKPMSTNPRLHTTTIALRLERIQLELDGKYSEGVQQRCSKYHNHQVQVQVQVLSSQVQVPKYSLQVQVKYT